MQKKITIQGKDPEISPCTVTVMQSWDDFKSTMKSYLDPIEESPDFVIDPNIDMINDVFVTGTFVDGFNGGKLMVVVIKPSGDVVVLQNEHDGACAMLVSDDNPIYHSHMSVEAMNVMTGHNNTQSYWKSNFVTIN